MICGKESDDRAWNRARAGHGGRCLHKLSNGQLSEGVRQFAKGLEDQSAHAQPDAGRATDVSYSQSRPVIVACRDDNGSFGADIDTANLTVQFHSMDGTTETYRDGQPYQLNDEKCTEFVRTTDQAYQWGWACPDHGNDMVYTLNRYTGVAQRNMMGFLSKPAQCAGSDRQRF